LVDAGSVALTANPNSVNQTRTTSWSAEVSTIFTVTFADHDHARAFFNAGGQVRIASARTGGSATTQNTSWSTILSGAGTLIFDTTDYFALTTTYATFANFTGAGAYHSNDWDIDVKSNTITDGTGRGGKGNIITFRLTYDDNHIGYGGPDLVDGTLTTSITMRNVDGTPLTITAPTFNTTNLLSS